MVTPYQYMITKSCGSKPGVLRRICRVPKDATSFIPSNFLQWSCLQLYSRKNRYLIVQFKVNPDFIADMLILLLSCLIVKIIVKIVKFLSYMNFCHPNIQFIFKKEYNDKPIFVYVNKYNWQQISNVLILKEDFQWCLHELQ